MYKTITRVRSNYANRNQPEHGPKTNFLGSFQLPRRDSFDLLTRPSSTGLDTCSSNSPDPWRREDNEVLVVLEPVLENRTISTRYAARAAFKQYDSAGAFAF